MTNHRYLIRNNKVATLAKHFQREREAFWRSDVPGLSTGGHQHKGQVLWSWTLSQAFIFVRRRLRRTQSTNGRSIILVFSYVLISNCYTTSTTGHLCCYYDALVVVELHSVSCWCSYDNTVVSIIIIIIIITSTTTNDNQNHNHYYHYKIHW